MGHKVHPIGFRLGVIKGWQANWFAGKGDEYRRLILEDMKVRQFVGSHAAGAGISRVELERSTHELLVTIHTARPGIVIGRGGQRVEEMRKHLEQLVGKRVRLNIQEIRQPELDAYLVAKNVAEQIERRVSYRRAMKQSALRTMQAGAKGVKIIAAGRLGGNEIARREKEMQGRLPLHTLRADIDFAIVEAHTTLGRIGIKTWIYKGDQLPQAKAPEVEEMEPISLVVESGQQEAPDATAQAGKVSQVP